MTKTKRQGLTLIEVMLVLALSGVLVVAALSTFRGRNSFTFQNNVRQVGENIRTVANETKSGLGPVSYAAGATNNTDPKKPAALTPPFSTDDNIYGEAIEFYPKCDSSNIDDWCLVVHKLKINASKDISAYERYPIELPSNLKINYEDTQYNDVDIDSVTTPSLNIVKNGTSPSDPPSEVHHLVLSITNSTGEAYAFARKNSSIDMSGNYLSGEDFTVDKTDVTEYTLERKGKLHLVLEDKNNSNAKGFIDIDLKNPTSLEVSFP